MFLSIEIIKKFENFDGKMADSRSENYDLGAYRIFQFNERDLEIRRDLGLYAEEFFPEEDLPTVLRNIAKNPPKKHLILPASEVLSNPNEKRHTDYISYKPIRISS